MKNIMFTLLTATALTVSAGAYAADESSSTQSNVEQKDNGGYKSTVKTDQTTTAGTSITSKTTANVDVDSDGKTSKTLESTSTADPKGMMNKKTHTGELDYKDKSNGGYKKTVTSKDTDAAGTNVTSKKSTNVDVDANGNVTSTVKTDQVTDPKGLMNKTETQTKTKSVNGVVTEKTSQTN